MYICRSTRFSVATLLFLFSKEPAQALIYFLIFKCSTFKSSWCTTENFHLKWHKTGQTGASTEVAIVEIFDYMQLCM